MDINSLKIRLSLLSSLRNLLDTPIISAYKAVFESKTAQEFANNYASLCHKIYNTDDACISVLNDISCDENALTANLENPNEYVVNSVTLDLQTIGEILKLKTKDFNKYIKNTFPELISCADFLPSLPKCREFPFSECSELLEHYKTNGFGFFAKASSFTVNENGKILPVLCPDAITLQDLKGYKRQREQVIANTLAFLNKKPANNILLYGDKGTGKSSTVKAVAHDYADKGLKIIELSPRQIHVFPKICELAKNSPYRIIVFMDDLSFDREDDNFATLKAFIEGGLTGKPENVLLYATSNRRHLIRESFSDRQGDDIHVRDTLETITSLSDRFGLEITFSVPDKDEYLYIVSELAQSYNIDIEQDKLNMLAERFALRRNGRSPRTAQQFIRYMLTQENI